MPEEQKHSENLIALALKPFSILRPGEIETSLVDDVNKILLERSNSKVNPMKPIGEEKGCGCKKGGGGAGSKTDLIVLIDTSGSMGRSAKAVSDAVADAIEIAKRKCSPDLKITFLGVDGVWSGTVFYTSHRDYIYGIKGTIPLSADKIPVGFKREQGANAIEDLSKYSDWREGACRAIFYISDEELDSISPRNDFANETLATNAAITAANASDVTVFAHHLTYQKLAPQIIQNYKDLCDKTGGEAYFSSTPNKEEYTRLLSDAICNACGKSTCKEVEFPELEPCISVKWGDSECDCIESSDHEVMTLTVCNCYSNVVFRNFNIAMIEVLDAEGNPVPALPNGTPSVKVHPIGTHCFGDIEPCSCVTREFVIILEGAKAGKYQCVVKGIHFEIAKLYGKSSTLFEFEICKD